MARRGLQGFHTIRSEGGLLSSGLLQRIAAQDLADITPASYHLAEGEKLKERISRSWSRALGLWRAFEQGLEKSSGDLPATSLTREKWLLPLFEELGYGRLQPTRALSVDGRDYPISHLWGKVPIHLVGAKVDLDRRTKGVVGASTASPHGLVQDLLNRSEAHLWGLVSNGMDLRVLRDHSSLTRQAFVEFDLQTMLEGEHFADFALLWLVCHQSRFEGEKAEEFGIERWSREGTKLGVRALDHLREGVEKAIEALGTGFLATPGNDRLKAALRTGELVPQDFYRELLRLVYRLIFLFVAEDRELLHSPTATTEARARYRDFYSTTRLRELARTIRGGRHVDLWRMLRHVSGLLHEHGSDALGLPALGGFLWSPSACGRLDGSDLDNAHLLAAIRHLSFIQDNKIQMPADWRNLGSEELGSVYESLLELHPEIHGDAARFDLTSAAGHERKTTGSYYTPSSLIQCLLDSALDPVLDEAAKKSDPAKAILALKVCDPACGSGHFLVAAAHRIARRLASVRTGEEEPSPEAYRTALRDVIGHCLHGVDLNPMAVELCKVSLWMEALEPGKPLSFLDHKIRCGNSLLGTTPALIGKGIPDDAFEAIEGDDKVVAREFRKRNRDARKGQATLFASIAAETEPIYSQLGVRYGELDVLGDARIADLQVKESRHAAIEGSADYRKAKFVADAWCAAFVWRKTRSGPDAITQDMFERLTREPDLATAATIREVQHLAEQFRFFHWHLAFPDVFRGGEGRAPESEATGWSGGFDVVLGNPPWEQTELKELEWFATRAPEIANASTGAARKRMIEALAETDAGLHRAFLDERRTHDAIGLLITATGRYPLCGRGRINSYSIFAEAMRCVLSSKGRVGCIVPSGIATDDTTKYFFQDLMETRSLLSLYDFVNDAGLFPGVGHGRLKYALLTLTGRDRPAVNGSMFAFHASRVEDLRDPHRRFVLSAEDVALLNPNTRTCPVFRTGRDAEITKSIYRRVPVLIREGPPEQDPWRMTFKQGLFNMTTGSEHFRTRAELEGQGWTLAGNVFGRGAERYLPLYEAKMIHHFDHRYGDYADRPAGSENTSLPDVPLERLKDSHYAPIPRYWVPECEVASRLANCSSHPFLFGWRDLTHSGNERTVVGGLIPIAGVGHTFLLMFPVVGIEIVTCLLANLSSFAFDYVARQKVGGIKLMYFTMKQLPVLPPSTYSERCPWSPAGLLADWILPRVLELVYTAHDLAPFARACGYDGEPFRWNPERRFDRRCELDAAFFHLYGLSRDDVAYILDTFPIVRRNDEKAHGTYRTKETILRLFDEMAAASTVAGRVMRETAR